MVDVIWLDSTFGIPMMHCFLYRFDTSRVRLFFGLSYVISIGHSLVNFITVHLESRYY
jgi:hypothetical protein